MKSFLRGFTALLPSALLNFLSVAELSVMISGPSKIDVEEMKKYTIYTSWSKEDNPVKWYWEVLEEFN